MSNDGIDRTRLPEPSNPPVGYQRWADLAFVHWRVPSELLRPWIPASLSIDTWNGEAWLGLVAFSMSGVRPAWAPALPYLSAFPETNLRTYVHREGAAPGVWFFSLDASRWLAVQAARWGWGLNYRWSRMQVNGSHPQRGSNAAADIRYRSRRWLGPPCSVDLELGIRGGAAPRLAAPGTLDYFLCERYLLYTLSAGKQLFQARVHHEPYPLVDAELRRCEQTLTDSIGCPCPHWPEHVVSSPGVHVNVYAMQKVAT